MLQRCGLLFAVLSAALGCCWVDNPIGVSPIPANANVTVTTTVLGANQPLDISADLPSVADFTQAGVAAAFTTMGTASYRFPQGNWVMGWNPTSNGNCNASNPNLTFNANDTFQAAITNFAATGLHPIVPDGSNCTTQIDPSPAASMVNMLANTNACVVKCPYWTFLNEAYLAPTDTACVNQPTCYATNYLAVRARMRAQNSNIKVCADADPQKSGTFRNWDATMLPSAAPDCVDMHYYYYRNANNGLNGGENDPGLLNNVTQDFGGFVGAMKADLTAAGMPNIPIIIGEVGSDASTFTKQISSVTQAIWYAEVVGEMENNGIAEADYHIGFDNCQNPASTPSPGVTLYGWQSWANPSLISNASNGGTQQLPGAGTCSTPVPAPSPPAVGTILPTGAAMQVLSHFVKSGESILQTTVSGGGNTVKAYATTFSGTKAELLINLNQNAGVIATVTINGQASGNGGNVYTYSKAIYDLSQAPNQVWNGPTTTTLASWVTNFTIVLPPWSITVVQSG